MDNFYVYAWLDPTKPCGRGYKSNYFPCEPFYIGKGRGRRYLNTDRRNYQFKKKLRSTDNPFPVKIKRSLSEADAFALEVELIHAIGRIDIGTGPLVNLTSGGEGPRLSEKTKRKIALGRTGHRHSEETKQRISMLKKGKTPNWTPEGREKIRRGTFSGKRHSNDTKRKIRLTKMGARNPNYKGKSVTEATRKLVSLHVRGVNNPFYGKKHTEQTKSMLSILASQKTGADNPFFGRKHNPITKEAIAAHFRHDWILFDKEGDVHLTSNLRSFCEEMGLCYSSMRKVACGIAKSSKGWTISKNEGRNRCTNL